MTQSTIGLVVADTITEALRESEERYRTLFEQTPVGVFLYDRSLRITECNQHFVDLLRSTFERLIGLDMHRLIDQDILPSIERALEGEPSYYEGPYRATTSDAKLYISMRLSPLRDAEGHVVGGLGVVEDITDRMRALAALRSSEERLSLHVKHSPLGVVSWDLNGKVVEWNEAAMRIFGFTAAEMLGQDGLDRIVPEEAREHVAKVSRRLFAKSGGDRSTNENVTKDGRRILCDWYNTPLVDAHGIVIGVASLVADITERKHAEEALKRSEARFRELIERVPESLAVSRQGVFVYVNPAFVRYLDYASADDLIGRTLADVTHPDDRPILAVRGLDIVKGVVLPPHEYRLLRRDGSIVTCEINSVKADFDGLPSVIGVARDVTERKQMQLRLLQTDRMASVGTLAAGVAHEINNPLAYLMANLDVVASRKLPELEKRLRALELAAGAEQSGLRELESMAEMIGIAREGAERVRDIVRDLKTFSRADDEKRGPVDVRRVLDASINMAWNEIRHRARLMKDYAEVPAILANESRLGQLFLNLLVNAAQALQVGSARDNEIAVRVRHQGDRIEVEVSDTGPGISKEVIERIFDPFFTTKPVGVGTGLGLWICQGIVTSLGGEISVRSELGRGATFKVSLPSAHVPYEERPPISAPQPSQERRGRVLVIDDEPAVATALSEAISEEHDVQVVKSGRQALELLRKDDRFDVILCDLMMPDVSGFDVYEALRAEGRSVIERILFMTGGAFSARAREFLDQTRSPVVEKPFDLARVMELLRAKVGRG